MSTWYVNTGPDLGISTGSDISKKQDFTVYRNCEGNTTPYNEIPFLRGITRNMVPWFPFQGWYHWQCQSQQQRYLLVQVSWVTWLSRSVPNAKSHSLTSLFPLLDLLLQPHLWSLKLHRSVLTTPDWIPWTSPCCIPTYSQNSKWNHPLQPQRCSSLPRSCGHHVTIA